MLRPYVIAALAVSISLTLAACDSLDAQADYRADAAAAPAGFTRTVDGITLIEDDPDDWRTAPRAVTSGFRVSVRAFPNPADPQDAVNIGVSLTGELPGGLRLVGRTTSGRLIELDEQPEASQPGTYFFQFVPAVLLEGASGGLRRVILFERQTSEPVTYGDVLIE